MLNGVAKNKEDYSKEINWLLDEKYGGLVSDVAQTDIARIKQGEPVAYVIGFVDFLSCKIDLSQKPLIPRVETEFWIEYALKEISYGAKVLDIFAGSGCIGVSTLKHIPSAQVNFVDVDPRAIKQIKINCEFNNIDVSRYQIIQSDAFENIRDSYDYIFANPPYIAESKKDIVQESVLVHEPYRALFAGNDGLSIIEPFLKQAIKYLNKGGKLYMEFDEHQKDDIEKILKDAGFSKYDFYQDQFKKWRYLCARP